MERRLYALLVGIDTYPRGVGISDLRGCVNDVGLIKDYLEDTVTLDKHIEVLTGGAATRENIIRLFREHLCLAGENDVVYFHYSGHGSTEVSAPVFTPYFPNNRDETIVCYDSRLDGGYDLADKELAALLWTVAEHNPHVVVSLDCCHSGSGTRDTYYTGLAATRQTPARSANKPRPLETYLDGFYGGGEEITRGEIPPVKHILLAACGPGQQAWETTGNKGLFTFALLETLEKSGGHISYADLFVRCRATMFKRNARQKPQFETYGRFHPYTRFLDGQSMAQKEQRYHVCFQKGDWIMTGGALHGLPTEAEKPVKLALYPETYPDKGRDKIAGYALVSTIEAQTSTLIPDFQCHTGERFHAEVVSLPVPPVPVRLEGDHEGKARVREYHARHHSQWSNFTFTETDCTETGGAKYVLDAMGNGFYLRGVESKELIQGATGSPEPCLNYIFSILEHVLRWERGLELQNHRTGFNMKKVDFKLVRFTGNNGTFIHTGDGATFVIDDYRHIIPAFFRAQNRLDQELHAVLLHFSRTFKISVLANETLPPGKGPVTLAGENRGLGFGLPRGVDQAIDTFKLMVSTSRVDDFLLPQDEIMLGKTLEFTGDRFLPRRVISVKHEKDWFTRTIVVNTIRRQSEETG